MVIILLLFACAASGQVVDTSAVGNDSIRATVQEEKSSLEDPIDYQARDSILFNVKQQIVEMFGEAMVDYGSIHLEAGYIRIDFSKFVITAYGLPDSNGVVQGIPKFKDGEQEFESDTIVYNYETKKGIIQHIFSEQGGGFLHGDRVKKLPDNTILVRDGSFTTCDQKDPHFQICFNKAKVIPNDKIVTGPVWLEIEDIPTPLALPFGFFPNKKGRASGILIPSYGESTNRGFFLENGGYYFGISDYFDLAVRGDIYSRGSWALKTQSNYKKKYKYDGNLSLSFARNIFGERNTPDFSKNSDFFVKWYHTQDPKARPNSRFSANVQAGTSNYNTYNPSS
ncbi:MAG TPA: putative LPS assembly protein LptD, partial [Bacteroidales bacterium]|nr:putative LPS assembly protein LptD [Bacteroidales bacterium]